MQRTTTIALHAKYVIEDYIKAQRLPKRSAIIPDSGDEDGQDEAMAGEDNNDGDKGDDNSEDETIEKEDDQDGDRDDHLLDNDEWWPKGLFSYMTRPGHSKRNETDTSLARPEPSAKLKAVPAYAGKNRRSHLRTRSPHVLAS